MRGLGVVILGTAIFAASCGGQDASGIYVVKSDDEVALVQLVEGKGRKLAGRVEVNAIGPDAIVTTKSASLDGSVSGNELILRPASIWFGGLEASGTYSSSSLKLTSKGVSLTAERSSLDEYQDAVSKLKSDAAERQATRAEADAAMRQEKARVQNQRETAASITTIRDAASRIANDATRLNNGISKSPDFAKMAAVNTAKISRMLAAAPTMSEDQRYQLGVQANQVIVDTNQIDVAREQYAIRLNDMVNDATNASATIAKLCGENPPSQFASVCQEAFAAMKDFKAAFERGRSSFSPYEQKVATEIRRQEQLAAKID